MAKSTSIRVRDQILRIYKKSKYTYRDGVEWFARELMRHDKDFIEAEKKRLIIEELELEEKKRYHEIQAQKIQTQIEEIDIYIRRLDKMLEKENIPYELYDGLKSAMRIIDGRIKHSNGAISPFELETGEGKRLIDHLSNVFDIPISILENAVKEKYGGK